MKPITMKTKRLLLRRANEHDAASLFLEYFSNKESATFLTRNPHENIEQTKIFLHEWCSLPWVSDNNRWGWIIALADTNKAIGIFLVELEDQKAQIHYGVSNEFSSQGIITEAGAMIVNWLKDKKMLRQVWAVCDLENVGSKKVLEKLHFRNDGVLKNELYLPAFDAMRDCYCFVMESA